MYTEKELSSLIEDVTKEFTSHLAKAEESFKASKPEESEKKDEKKPEEHKESEKPEAKDQAQAAPSKEEAPKAESKEQMPQEAGKEQAQAPQAAAPEAQDAHGYDDEDMQHMHSMYSSMSKPELKAHHDCIRKCMDGMAMSEQGMAKAEMEDAKEGEHRPNGGPTDGEAASKKAAPASDAQALEKSEKTLEIEMSSIKEVEILKSELQAAKAESEATKKNLEAVETFLKKFVEKAAPAGKAITSLDVIAKTESATKTEKPLSKSEIDSKLLAKAKDQSLSKSDREAINSYYFTKNIEKVSHLLK